MVITAPNLSSVPGLVHAFTTRDVPPDRLAEAAGAPSARVVSVRQVHGGAAVCVSSDGDLSGTEADAMVTGRAGLLLSVRTADCCPILLADPRKRAVAAVHAGWRGTLARVLPNAVRKMKDAFGSDPADLMMAVGPCIGMAAFEVSRDVADLFRAELPFLGAEVKPAGEKAHIDLAAVNARLAESAGLDARRIWVSGRCTYSDPALFHSYRRDGKAAGRLAGAIGWLA